MGRKLKRYFIYGLTIFLPLLLTVYLITFVLKFIDGFLGKFFEPIFRWFFGFYYWGMSIVVFVLLIFLIGFVATHFFGRKLYPYLEKLLLKLPVFKQIYPAAKEIAIFLFSREKTAFKQVVIVEYPRQGIYSMGFLVGDGPIVVNERVGRDLCNILIPSSPSPFTGFVIMVPRQDVIFPDITVEEAVKFIVSDGVVNPGSSAKQKPSLDA